MYWAADRRPIYYLNDNSESETRPRDFRIECLRAMKSGEMIKAKYVGVNDPV